MVERDSKMFEMDLNVKQEPMDAPTNADIQAMMAAARRQIEEHKIRNGLVQPPNPADRIAELKAQINARLAAKASILSQGIQQPPSGASKPAPLILNAEGRTVDSSGKEVQLVHRIPTLKANIRSLKTEPIVKISQDKSRQEEDTTELKFLDTRVEARAPVRSKRMFNFHEKGTFENLAKRMRTKAQLEKLQNQIAQAAKKTGISSAARLALLSSIVPKKEKEEEEIPESEWWDSFLMKDSSYEDSVKNSKRPEEKFDGITHLIEHPMQMKPPSEPAKPILLPVFLTKKEKKKLRRQNRREAWKEKQEKIRLGLEPPPEPKVKMSNMMRVLGTQAVQDPTKIEAHVREQMAKRQKAHEEANDARKLTFDQKKQKKVKKVKEDTSLGVHVAVYRVLSLHDPAKKFKVEMNAKQLQMTGAIVLYKNINVIVVEGGPKQQKKFKNLMLNRIKWSEDSAVKNSDESDFSPNKCWLVWEGLAKSRAFQGDIKLKISPNESFAREIFKNHGVEQYWDLAYSMTVLDSVNS